MINGDKPDPSGTGNAKKGKPKFLIAGIGASAGGLEAIQEFLAKIPADAGIGFVIVTHQSPERTSLLPEILARCTRMQVLEAAEGMKVEPNKVYVAPSGWQLSIAEGTLHLAALSAKLPHFPIDFFFRSLSVDQRENAVGIVLSGTGSDGTLGVRAIKETFGMVLVQDSTTARYSGMPSSADATGLADFVLRPSEMPQRLASYAHGLLILEKVDLPVISKEPFQQILLMLRDHTGTDFSVYKTNTVHRRIRHRMNVLRINELAQYVRYLQENPAELNRLFDEMLINVTSFFRDPEAFEALTEKALPDRIKAHQGGEAFRVWVPGCASGEEAYSVAIAVVESMEKRKQKLPLQIFATDLDARVMETARQGIYAEGIAVDVSQDRLARFFVRQEGLYRFRRELREMIVFATHNLIKEPPFTKMDLIVCRNLLIYFNAEMQRWVLQLFHHSLKKGGVLFLGPSETIGPFKDLFETVDAKWKIYKRREFGVETQPFMTRPTGVIRIGPKDAETQPVADRSAGRQETQIQKFLLSRFAPCSVIVDEHGSIVYIHGRSGLYLEPPEGRPRNNIVDMAREGLKQAMHGTLSRAVHEKTEIVRDHVRVHTNGGYTEAILTITPIQEPALQGLMLVTIGPAQAPPEPPKSTGGESRSGHSEALERELRYTQESLQSTIDDLQISNEELRASNEELQSTNEELQSTNEEMETSKEEMQSLNEEMTTVNTELQIKVDELARSTDDMQNLLNSTNVATVFLDEHLHIKRYTEDAKALFHFVPSDIGRPLSDLVSNLRYESLMQDCRDVLKMLVRHEKEIATLDGKRYLMRILPYRTAENVISGVVMTFVDIESMRKAEASRDFFESIVQTLREPMIVLDGELRVFSANKAFFETFHAVREETVDKLIYDLGNNQWDIPSLRKLLEEILPLSASFHDYRVDHDFPKIGRRSFLLNASRLERHPGEPGMILLAFKDITSER